MNAKWHIINHLACAVVFLSVCSFSAFSQERDTIFIIEHDTVWMDPQPDTIIESQTRENRYDRRVHRYRRHWEALIPTHTKIQFAGNMGLLSFGTGWDYGRRNQWETDVFFGVLPKYDSKRTKLTFTVKQNYLPWSLQIKQSRFSVEPLACGMYLNTVFGDEFWVNEPERYPKGYYGFSSLIVDDNRGVLTALQLLLKPYFEGIITLPSPVTLPSVLRERSWQVVLLDMNFTSGINTGNEGLYWLHEIKKQCPTLPVVLFTAYADIDLAVRGIKEGATDFVVKPWNNQKLVETLLNAVSASETKSPANGPNARRTAENNHPLADIRNMYWGNSSAMQQLRLLVEKVASTDANILITGENGTGKEMLAREIHSLSPRNRQEMVSVDMGAVTESLFESELFGHVKGSFTDAHADRAGKFEAASRSTLFLDEIGNLPYHLQAKLLTAIQRRSIVRVGSNTPIPVDIRLICATNRNLPEMVAKGEFREDLLYRINTIHLEIPSLRERPEDIIPLAELFIARFCKQYDKPPVKLTDGACEKLTLHPWYGNIRELEHAIEKAIIICDNETLPAELFQLARRTGTPEATASTLEEMEMQMIRKTLDKCSGNLSAVAAQLGITRQTLYNKMKKYGL